MIRRAGEGRRRTYFVGGVGDLGEVGEVGDLGEVGGDRGAMSVFKAFMNDDFFPVEVPERGLEVSFDERIGAPPSSEAEDVSRGNVRG